MIGLAVVAGALAVWWLVPAVGPGWRRLVPKARTARAKVNPWRICLVGCLVGVVVGVLVKPVAIVTAVAMVVATVAWVVGARLRNRRALKAMTEVVRAARTVESLLALGQIPPAAVALAAQDCPILDPVVAAVRVGGEPWDVLGHLASRPGQAGLGEIGRAWQVCERTGASMRLSLANVRANLEEAADTAGVVAGELSGPRATAQILAVLPFFGLGMVAAMGADPLGFLTSTVIGRGCLLSGVSLACLGVIWSEILARRVSGLEPRRQS